MKRLLAVCSLAVLPACLAPAQMGNYLDVFQAKVRPEKRSEFDAIARKIADANRKAKGDFWIALQNEYGEGNVVYFVSQRDSYADIDKSGAAFMAAVNEGYVGGVKKMMQDFENTIVSSRAEIRRRRPDLSANAPKDAEAYSKLVGQARWLRTIEVQIKPGRQNHFESLVKQVTEAYEKDGSWAVFVSQAVAGVPGATYYISSLQPSLAGFDSAPDLRKLLSPEQFDNIFQKGSSEDVLTSETRIMRILPELSNPPEQVANASAEFWRPKPVAMAKAKPAQ